MNEQLIDHLVAGDLDEAQRRELLAWLDDEPTRWRRCGLAFLEAQLWQEAFDGVIRRTKFKPDPRRITVGAGDGGRWRRIGAVSFAAAAVFVAFGLGLVAGAVGPWSSTPRDISAVVAKRQAPSETHGRAAPIPSSAVVQQEAEAAHEVTSSAVRAPQSGPVPAAVQTFAVLKLATGDSGIREVHVPVLHGPAVAQRWLKSEPDALPPYVQRQLEQRGYHLLQRRRFLQVQLEDGRYALIPVDQYQVRSARSQSS